MAVQSDRSAAWSTSADECTVRYDLTSDKAASRAVPTNKPGRSAVAVRSDGAILGTGGWDGKVRLHRTDVDGRPQVAISDFFKDTVQSLAFAPDMRSRPSGPQSAASEQDSDDDEDELDQWDLQAEERRATAYRWLAAGSKDGRIALFDVNVDRMS